MYLRLSKSVAIVDSGLLVYTNIWETSYQDVKALKRHSIRREQCGKDMSMPVIHYYVLLVRQAKYHLRLNILKNDWITC